MKYLNRKKLEELINKKNISISEFAKRSNISRQSLYNMFKGKQIFSGPFEKILKSLGVGLEEIMLEKSEKSLVLENFPKEIAQAFVLLTEYAKKNSASLFLIGSRAKGKKGIRSDWDFAIYFSKPYDHAGFSVLKDKISKLSFPYRVDLANLNAAPDWFISSIEKEAVHLFGKNSKISKLGKK